MEIIHLTEVDSTNRYLKTIVTTVRPLNPWTVVLADRQSAGYGQRGRKWESGPGGLYVSFLLAAELASPVFTLLAGLAVLEACRETTGAANLGLKWVNDLVQFAPSGPGERGMPNGDSSASWRGVGKVGGILTEGCQGRWLILGIGINIRPLNVAFSSSLWEASGKIVDRWELLTILAQCLRDWLARWQAQGSEIIISSWLSANVTIGREVQVVSAGEILRGRAVGLDHEGGLILELVGGGQQIITSGTLRLADGSYA